MDNKKTGKLISALRREHNLTQRELADMLFVTDKAVSKWETGKGAPEISMLLPISEALDISVVELLEGERASQNDKPIASANKKIIDMLSKRRLANIIAFIISTFCLIISVRLFWNTAIFCDEFNTSPDIIDGGLVMLLLDWARLFLLLFTSLLSFIGILKK